MAYGGEVAFHSDTSGTHSVVENPEEVCNVMKEQETFFKIVGSGLKILAGGIQAVAERVESLASEQKRSEGIKDRGFGSWPDMEENEPAHGTKIRVTPEPLQKQAATNAPDAIMAVFQESEGPVDIDRLVAETGLERRKIHNTLYRLKKQGKIRNVAKGVYTKW
jgi:predicted Rossmann fold nucleotide-binding protein DprA/Smf involved in DNA uptake